MAVMKPLRAVDLVGFAAGTRVTHPEMGSGQVLRSGPSRTTVLLDVAYAGNRRRGDRTYKFELEEKGEKPA